MVSIHQAFAMAFAKPLLERKQGRNTFECLKTLRRFQRLNSDEIRKFQRKRLRYLLNHSYEHVPYYRKVFRERKLKPQDIHDLRDLEKLPVLTKDIVRKNYLELMANNCSPKEIIFSSTSGTTGEPVKFLKTKQQESWENAAGYLATSWYGFEPCYKHAVIWALPSSRSVFQKKLDFVFRERFLNSFQMTKEAMRQFARELITFKPDVLRGYSNMLHFFAQFVKEEGIEVRPKAVVATGEELLDQHRQEIQDVFKCDAFSFYASREISAIAAECSTHQGYHIMASNVVLEILKEGLPIAPEEMGAITLTDLCNYGMPLIRYQLGDLGSLSTEECSCGKCLPMLKSLDGRISDVLVSPNSKYTASPSAHFVFKGLPVKQYQIIQETEKEIKILLVRDEGFSEKDENEIAQRVHEYLGSFSVTFEYVSSISMQKSGKRRVIISHVQPKVA